MAKRISFLLRGKVQGVYFRRFAQSTATALHIVGWVRNTSDGCVEGEAQGEEEKIEKFVKELGIGPRLAKVARVERRDVDVKGEGDVERGFEVR